MKITDLPRNDLGAALSYYAEHRPIGADEYEMLILLQEDPAELLRLSSSWQITDPAGAAVARNDAILRNARLK